MRVCAAVVLVSFAIVVALGVNMYTMQTAPKAHADYDGDYNAYPYGECTWFANERFHDIYGYYVPWHIGNANEWVDQAYNYGWQVSSTPSLYSLIVLQDGVQGATGYGHVAMVEQIESDGTIIASSMNAGAGWGSSSDEEYWSGPGVAFIKP
ncbi:hypothetical protein KSX_35660 [Ktedonospora formicarum]|uniref:Peptidase C51 domain-containing protein n=1 Tax=Ktedonospora formicarum TaxID=2778364 RepID=A0A8J3MT99_9CHLR|nr:hypothetical protein KSX_35660 [Ktedonospora formicarum]